MGRVVAAAGPCVSTVEEPCFRITTSPESATLLYLRNSYDEDPGYLAGLTSPH